MIYQQLQSFDSFVNLFMYYLCSRCERGAPHHENQRKVGGAHAHNGEILPYLAGAKPNSQRILSAYSYYTQHTAPVDIYAGLANAYNRPTHYDPKRTQHRPAMAAKLLMDNRHSTWIRHGIENTQLAQYNTNELYPMPITRFDVGNSVMRDQRSLNRYAIDMDRFPFRDCAVHPGDRETGQPWSYVAGYIPFEKFTAMNGTVYNPNDRDHLYAHSAISTKHWCFVYDDFDHNINNSQEQTLTHQQTALDRLLDSAAVPVIQSKTVLQLNRLINLLDCYSDAIPHLNKEKSKK